jgi:hypothetical protein
MKKCIGQTPEQFSVTQARTKKVQKIKIGGKCIYTEDFPREEAKPKYPMHISVTIKSIY